MPLDWADRAAEFEDSLNARISSILGPLTRPVGSALRLDSSGSLILLVELEQCPAASLLKSALLETINGPPVRVNTVCR